MVITIGIVDVTFCAALDRDRRGCDDDVDLQLHELARELRHALELCRRRIATRSRGCVPRRNPGHAFLSERFDVLRLERQRKEADSPDLARLLRHRGERCGKKGRGD